mmetsp:Transcript_4948/g.15037  ORF Transcript_4948/g.15037 Transcript_4948/m.15037 type:complete len:397 (+) Transcript_4948:17-1207(+)
MAFGRLLLLWLPSLSFLAYTAREGAARLEVSLLASRIDAFRAAHPEHRPPAAQKLLEKHRFSLSSVEKAFLSKYGSPLPPEGLPAVAEDPFGTAVYLGWRAAAARLREASGRLPEWARPDRVSAAATGLFQSRSAEAARRWEAVGTGARLGGSAVAAAGLRLLLPSAARLPLLVAWVALAWTAVPTPNSLTPTALLAELQEAWMAEGAAPMHAGLCRLSLVSGGALITAAFAGPAHAPPVLGGWLLGALAASLPPPVADLTAMAFVEPSARGALRSAMQQQPLLLQQHDFGLARVVTLNSDRQGWEAPIVAVGALGRWFAFTSISASSNGTQQTLHSSGVLLPTSSVLIIFTALLFVGAALANDQDATTGAKAATVTLLAAAALSFAAFGAVIMAA